MIESLVPRLVVHLKQRPYGRNDFHDPAAAEAVVLPRLLFEPRWRRYARETERRR